MKNSEIRKDQFIHLISKFGKKDVLDVVPWSTMRLAEFDDDKTAGECIVYRDCRGNSWAGAIKIRDDDDEHFKFTTVLHEAAHAITKQPRHDRRFAVVCWGLVLRSGMFDFYEWQQWIKTRGYDIQDDDRQGAMWAQSKAAQLARSNPLMFRLRLLKLKFNDFNFYKYSGAVVGTLALFSWVAASHFRG